MLGAVLAWFVADMIGGHPAISFVMALFIAPVLVGSLLLLLILPF